MTGELHAELIRLVYEHLDDDYFFEDGGQTWPLRTCSGDELRVLAEAHEASDCTTEGCAFTQALRHVAALLDRSQWTTCGEFIAHELGVVGPHCARCALEGGVEDIVEAGEWLLQNASGDLTEAELAIVDLCRSWLAEDAITRCLDEAEHDG